MNIKCLSLFFSVTGFRVTVGPWPDDFKSLVIFLNAFYFALLRLISFQEPIEDEKLGRVCLFTKPTFHLEPTPTSLLICSLRLAAPPWTTFSNTEGQWQETTISITRNRPPSHLVKVLKYKSAFYILRPFFIMVAETTKNCMWYEMAKSGSKKL